MGEIYHSVSVTGTRRLEAERVARVKQDTRQRQPDGGPLPQEPQPAAAAPEAGAPPAETEAAAGNVALEQDLLAAQERRLEQLETENQRLETDLAAAQSALDESRAALQQLEDQRRGEGYETGHAEASRAVQEQYEQQLAALDEARRLFSDSLQSQLEHVNQYAVEIAFSALARIIGEHHADKEFTRAVVREAITAVQGTSRVAIHVSQQDFDLLQGIEAELADAGLVTDLELIPDPRVSVGGCLIETDTGTWDARLETQLQRLRDSIEQARRKSG